MDGFEFPQPISTCLDIHAVEAMRKEILSSDVPLTIVPIAALTNIALLLTLYPEVKENIAEIVMMGGSLAREIQIQVLNLIRMSIHTLHKLFSNQVSVNNGRIRCYKSSCVNES